MRLLPIRPLPILASIFLAIGLLPSTHCAAQAAGKPQSDRLVFTNGEQLAGKLDHEADGNIYFKSDNAGMVKVPWDKLKQLRSDSSFAVIETGVPVGRKKANLDVPIGPIVIDGDTLTVTTANGTQQIPVKKIAYLVDEPTFENNVRHGQHLWQGITGSITAGASTVRATQNSESVNTSVALVRSVPAVDWMPPRERTLLNFSNSFGQISQPGLPTVKANILHGGIEQDEYFSPRFYLLQQALFDHNFAQGLDLQQLYGIGVGYTAIKSDNQQFDLTAVIDYTRQQFAGSPGKTQDIIGSNFGDSYLRKFGKKIIVTQLATISPAWNTPNDYSANGSVGAAFAVYKNFGFSIGVVDSFLNDPPAGFKKNSLQFNTGLTYTIQ